MARKYLLLCFCFCILCSRAISQSITVDKYSNQLFFNVFTESPDASIQDFLKLYLPSLYEKKKKEGIWVSNTTHTGIGHEEIHTFIFTKHPFLKATFTSGKLEFFCLRNNDLKDIQLTNMKLWFEFDTQPEAEMAFSSLVETFIPISTNKKFSSTNGAQKAEFSDTKETSGFGKVRFRLTADNLDHHIFKILFETENDL